MKRLQNVFKGQNNGTLYTHTHTHVISEKQNQTGRSMIEMLGVLAIIGVLSVMGIAGFSRAMDKNRANTIIHEAQKRATLVVPQIQLMGDENPTITEFINNDLGYGKFDTKVYTKTDNLPVGQFGIKVSGVNKSICQNILNTIGDSTVIRRLSTTTAPTTAMTTCGETNAFLIVYNNDMSSNAVAGEFGYDDCPESFYQCQTTHSCVASENDCPTCDSVYSGTIEEGNGGYAGTVGVTRCYCEESGNVYDATNGCQVKTGAGCSSFVDCDKDYFCNFDSACATTGTCKAVSQISTRTGTLTVAGEEYNAVCSAAGSNALDSFYKAEDWCLAQGGRLITSAEICNRTENSFGACPPSSGTRALSGQIYSLCNAGWGSDWMWATYSDNNRTSCYMFSFRLDGEVGTYESGNKSDRRALCLLPK